MKKLIVTIFCLILLLTISSCSKNNNIYFDNELFSQTNEFVFCDENMNKTNMSNKQIFETIKNTTTIVYSVSGYGKEHTYLPYNFYEYTKNDDSETYKYRATTVGKTSMTVFTLLFIRENEEYSVKMIYEQIRLG